ncbi:uncharacterized protein LOC108088384 [Drosophila ficusphila]|uniref:uncharacterized protein LOC108088384 n=1 Tax=Drosophila ficusphila TaxID=30025 RepID=UPI0007E66A35|nr:uncharacterized protein LOC108088384 [Drosophila ficusphila]
MFFRSSLLAVVLAFGLVSGLSVTLKLKGSKLKLPITKKIQQLQMETEEMAARDLATTQSCFGHYNPILNGVAVQFQEDYDTCEKNYANGSALITSAWNSTLYEIQGSGDQGCNTFFDCSSILDPVLVFECFANVGAEQSKIMYQVSANATEAATAIKILLVSLETEKESCQNTAERNYVEGTASTYEDLTQCLAGNPLPGETTTVKSQ